MGEREFYPKLLEDLSSLSEDEITRPLEELVMGPSSFGHRSEWTEWYHYLMPRLLERRWRAIISHPVELLFTGFMSQHPDRGEEGPYNGFNADALEALGKYIMRPDFWVGGFSDVPGCLNKWEGPTGIQGWFQAEGLLSASLFFCTKYLEPPLVGPWFRSVMQIENIFWRAQILTWLVGAHPILAGEIAQPSQFKEVDKFSVQWELSHVLAGYFSGEIDPPGPIHAFLPEGNRNVVLEIVGSFDPGETFEEILTNPKLSKVAAETAGLPETFRDLYPR